MISQEQVVESLGNMSVIQLVELTRTLEDKWGVAATPIPLPGFSPVLQLEPQQATQTEFSVILAGAGLKRIEVIKAVREVTGLGLAEAKAFVEAAPKVVKDGLAKSEADELKAKLEAVGATVELR